MPKAKSKRIESSGSGEEDETTRATPKLDECILPAFDGNISEEATKILQKYEVKDPPSVSTEHRKFMRPYVLSQLVLGNLIPMRVVQDMTLEAFYGAQLVEGSHRVVRVVSQSGKRPAYAALPLALYDLVVKYLRVFRLPTEQDAQPSSSLVFASPAGSTDRGLRTQMYRLLQKYGHHDATFEGAIRALSHFAQENLEPSAVDIIGQAFGDAHASRRRKALSDDVLRDEAVALNNTIRAAISLSLENRSPVSLAKHFFGRFKNR